MARSRQSPLSFRRGSATLEKPRHCALIRAGAAWTRCHSQSAERRDTPGGLHRNSNGWTRMSVPQATPERRFDLHHSRFERMRNTPLRLRPANSLLIFDFSASFVLFCFVFSLEPCLLLLQCSFIFV